ncbi:uncharacterized protein [Euphorbia lathyris]|uniref:uncharacterized protein n=1 Tax=Euphorbia lathyris TaxID=212925 RepID=UPI003313934B
MNLLFWNCRGISNRNTQRYLFNLFSLHKPDILCLAEPMVEYDSIPSSLWTRLGLVLVGKNNKEIPSLWILVRVPITFSVMLRYSHEQFSIIEVQDQGSASFIAFVYGSVWANRRAEMYKEILIQKENFQGNCSVMGDFNAILGSHEKSGRAPGGRSYRDFRNFIDSGNFIDTWSNGRAGSARVECRLDRVLSTSEFVDQWESHSILVLTRHHSDHSPILFQGSRGRRITRFRFQAMWVTHPGMRDVIAEFWHRPHPRLPSMQQPSQKLRLLRPILKKWNRDVFGLLDVEIAKAEESLAQVHTNISEQGFSTSLHQQELTTHTALDTVLHRKEIYLKEKSRVRWLKEGDHNITFFHRMATIRRASTGISVMQIDDELITDKNRIAAHISDYYDGLFRTDNLSEQNLDMVSEVIPKLVTDSDNAELVRTGSRWLHWVLLSGLLGDCGSGCLLNGGGLLSYGNHATRFELE